MYITKEAWKEILDVLKRHKISYTTDYNHRTVTDKHIQINLDIPDVFDEVKDPKNSRPVCKFCSGSHVGDRIYDKGNYPTNELYLTCVDGSLRLWKNDSYIGSYKIKYCPKCGREIPKKS